MELGDLIADKYRLERFLGEGGMGTVYAATNVVTGKPVAIKCLHAELTENEEYPARFLREAQVAGRIDHPNVVNVFDVGRHGSALFLVMELLQGETLAARIGRGPQDPTAFIQLMLPAMRGVHAAHRIGVTHRDLKPDNIFLCRGPDGESREAKVLDFGISKIGEELAGSGRRQLTLEGAIFGTPQYMAPEQIRSARSVDARSDVYALGVIFYRAFSGEFPFDSETLPGLALRIVEGNPVPIHELCPELEPGLGDAVMQALSVDPNDRFSTVAAFGQALEPYSGGLTFATTSPGLWDSSGLSTADGQLRTPGLRRAGAGKTPASQPQRRTPVSSGGQRTSAASPTPAGQSWQRARGPALGLALLFLALGGGLAWTIWGTSSRQVADKVEAPTGVPSSKKPLDSELVDRAAARPPEVKVSDHHAGAPAAPSAPMAAPPEVPEQVPAVGVEAPGNDHMSETTSREQLPRARRGRVRENARASTPKVVTAVEPASPAAAVPERSPSVSAPLVKPEPTAWPLLQNADTNPYLRH